MDGDVRYKNLLKFAMTKKSAKDVTVILIIDMSRPWTIMDTLNSWVHVLREHIHSLNLSPKELNEMEHNSKSVMNDQGHTLWGSLGLCNPLPVHFSPLLSVKSENGMLIGKIR